MTEIPGITDCLQTIVLANEPYQTHIHFTFYSPVANPLEHGNECLGST